MTRIIKRLENHVVAGLRLPIEVTRLNRREREIATVVYALHAGTAEDVCFNLSDELNNASVRSMLNRLVEKGILRRTRSGRAFVYLPAVTWADSGTSALKRFVEDYFDGCPAKAAASMGRYLNAS